MKQLSYNIMWIMLGLLLLTTAANGQDQNRHRNRVTVCSTNNPHEMQVNINQLGDYMSFPQRAGTCKIKASATGHFPLPKMTGTSATVVFIGGFYQLNGDELNEGDEIAAVTQDGLVAGLVVIDDPEDNIAMAVWVDDNQTPEIDGFGHEETMRFFLWSEDEMLELDETYITSYTLDDSCVLCQDDLKYNTNQVYVFDEIHWTHTLGIEIEEETAPGNYEVPSSIVIDGAYPNPFDSETRIRIHSPRQSAGVVEVFNVVGKIIMSVPVELTTGPNLLNVGLDGHPDGMYILIVRTDFGVSTRTIIKNG